MNRNVFLPGPLVGPGVVLVDQAGRKVEVIGQVFNLFNRKNLLAAWQQNALSPAFGVSSSAANTRQAEVAVRFTF